MNRLLRAFWDRLLPPGGDVAVAREPDDREMFVPGRRPLRVHWLGYRPEPRRLDDEPPGPADLDRHGRCWFWMGTPHAGEPCGSAWKLSRPSPIWTGGFWLPYSAMADPSAKP